MWNLAYISGQVPSESAEPEIQRSSMNEIPDDMMDPDISESGMQRRSSGESQEEHNGYINDIPNTVVSPRGEQDTLNEYLTIIPWVLTSVTERIDWVISMAIHC